MDYTGQRIDRFLIRATLGRGSSGAVYRAYDPLLEREVALKLLHKDDPNSVARFQREQQACTRLRHPNLAVIYGVGSTQGLPYIVMELVPGRNLAELVEVNLPTPERAAGILRDVARAVAYAHEEGVLHRDLKPANVILGNDGVARVVDFGLASLRENDQSLTQTGALLGTPSYMSPEQAAGLHADTQSDVYGLGATLYHLLTGRPPFLEAPLLEVHRRDIDLPSVHNPAVPPGLDAVCSKALARKPADRYPGADDLAEDLDRFLAGDPAVSEETPRRGWLLLLGAVVVIGLAAALLRLAQPSTETAPQPSPSVSSSGSDSEQAAALRAEARARARALAPYSEVRALLERAARAAAGDRKLEVAIAFEQARLAWRRLQVDAAERALAPLRASSERPWRAQAYFWSVTLRLHKGENKEARTMLKNAPGGPGVWGLLLECLSARLVQDHARALALARDALKLEPENPAAKLLCGSALLKLRRADEARALYEAYCAEDAPDDGTALIGLLVLERVRSQLNKSRTKSLVTRAWRLCAPERSPQLVLACAPAVIENGDGRTALRMLDHAPASGPALFQFLILRGLAHDKLFEPDAARKAWRAALERDRKAFLAALPVITPTALRLRLYRGSLLPMERRELSAQERTLARALADKALPESRSEFRSFLELTLLGHPLARLREHLPRLMRVSQRSRWVRFWVGLILAGRGDLASGRREMEASLRMGWDSEVALNLGLTLLRQARPQEAIRHLDEVARREPTKAPGLCARAAALNERGKHKEAMSACQRALGLQPKHIASLLLRAHVLAKLKRYGEARAQMRKAASTARYLDAFPLAQLAHTELEIASKRSPGRILTQAFLLAEQAMVVNDSPRLRVAAARVAMRQPARSPWARSAWDWLWEAERTAIDPALQGRIALDQGMFLLWRAAEFGERVARKRVDALWKRAAAAGARIGREGLDRYQRVFGAAYSGPK